MDIFWKRLFYLSLRRLTQAIYIFNENSSFTLALRSHHNIHTIYSLFSPFSLCICIRNFFFRFFFSFSIQHQPPVWRLMPNVRFIIFQNDDSEIKKRLFIFNWVFGYDCKQQILTLKFWMLRPKAASSTHYDGNDAFANTCWSLKLRS